jgi:hypothetical protein
MAQTASPPPQYGSTEHCYGQRSVHKQGNSLTVTIPRRMGIEAAGDTVMIRAGRAHGHVIYLKAIPIDAMLDRRPGTALVTRAEGGDRIDERELGTFRVRGGTTTTTALTIPAKCKTDRFATETAPMVVGAIAEGRLTYLKLIPECLYDHTKSIATPDLVRGDHTISD